MAHTGRKDAPELPDFALLKRLARDQLIFLLEQVRYTFYPKRPKQQIYRLLPVREKCSLFVLLAAREEGLVY